MSWTDDGTIPMGHEDIVLVIEPIRARAVANALLALLEFLEQSEIPGNYGISESELMVLNGNRGTFSHGSDQLWSKIRRAMWWRTAWKSLHPHIPSSPCSAGQRILTTR